MGSGIGEERISLYYGGDSCTFVTAKEMYSQTILSNLDSTLASWHNYEIQWQNNPKAEAFQDGVSKANHTTDVPTGDLVVVFREGTQREDKMWIDGVYIRKYVVSEPIHNNWGQAIKMTPWYIEYWYICVGIFAIVSFTVVYVKVGRSRQNVAQIEARSTSIEIKGEEKKI